jgi:hypothetical protein
MKARTFYLLPVLLLSWQTMATAHQAETRHVWEKVEITLQSQRQYENPYTDVQVWVDLKGPDFDKRCYGFWDGGKRSESASWPRPLAVGLGKAART